MPSPIERFLDRVRAAETRNQREIVITITEARDLHADITRLLLRMTESDPAQSQPIQVEFRGQDF